MPQNAVNFLSTESKEKNIVNSIKFVYAGILVQRGGVTAGTKCIFCL